MAERTISVVGLVGGVPYGAAALQALATADVVVGSPRQLRSCPTIGEAALRFELRGPLGEVLDAIEAYAARGAHVCVLASGDPGFFGIVRALAERVGAARLVVHPAPSSVSLAFARLGLPWDDTVVVSAHGRPLEAAVRAVMAVRPPAKVAVLTAPDHPPEALGKALLAAGAGHLDVAVASRLGEEDEEIRRVGLTGLAEGSFDPMSVVVLLAAGPRPEQPTLAWGLPESAYAHRGGMITKAEVRAVAIAKLALPLTGVLWDVGAGSGSVGIECARLSPGLEVIAVERDADQCERVRANAAAHGADVTVVQGEAPAALAGLPDPDRAFLGGGGIAVLDHVLDRLRPGGVVVASYTLVGRAVAAQERLGGLVQLSVSRAVPVGELGVRLAPENPVFVAWGPGGS